MIRKDVLMRAAIVGAAFMAGAMISPKDLPAQPAAVDGQAGTEEKLAKVVGVIADKITSNWSRPEKAPQAAVRIRVALKPDGSLDGAPVVENPSDDPVFRTFAASAVRAIYKAAPFDLSAYGDVYDRWKTLVMPFAGDEEQRKAASQEKAQFNNTQAKAEPVADDTETMINVVPSFKAYGNMIHALTFYKEKPDGTPMLGMAFCGTGSTKGSFALAVDFGEGMIWKGPEKVEVAFGDYRQVREMQVIREYLGFEGPDAKDAVRRLIASTGSLRFSGPHGLSVTFDINNPGEHFAQWKALCEL